jgi:hypothetical protein
VPAPSRSRGQAAACKDGAGTAAACRSREERTPPRCAAARGGAEQESEGLLGFFGLSGADRDRTGDPLLAKQVLSQLSYRPEGTTSLQVSRFCCAPQVGRVQRCVQERGAFTPSFPATRPLYGAVQPAPEPFAVSVSVSVSREFQDLMQFVAVGAVLPPSRHRPRETVRRSV